LRPCAATRRRVGIWARRTRRRRCPTDVARDTSGRRRGARRVAPHRTFTLPWALLPGRERQNVKTGSAVRHSAVGGNVIRVNFFEQCRKPVGERPDGVRAARLLRRRNWFRGSLFSVGCPVQRMSENSRRACRGACAVLLKARWTHLAFFFCDGRRCSCSRPSFAKSGEQNAEHRHDLRRTNAGSGQNTSAPHISPECLYRQLEQANRAPLSSSRSANDRHPRLEST